MKSIRHRNVIISTTTVAAVALTGTVLIPSAVSAAPAKAIPTVTAHLGKSVKLSDRHLHPGRVTFAVNSAKGEHTLQIARLHKGYTLADANQDIGKGFGGDAAAIRRVDHHVTFNGGVAGKPGKTGYMTITLAAGKYMAVNFDNGAARSFTVSGKSVNRRQVKTTAKITMLTYGFESLPSIPRSGVMRLGNVSDQPHFLVMQRVKSYTTRKMLKKAFASESNSRPSFLLKGGTDSGVLSENKSQAFSYSLPAGRYVIACFWPDDDTGMVHAAMGMYKLITLH